MSDYKDNMLVKKYSKLLCNSSIGKRIYVLLEELLDGKKNIPYYIGCTVGATILLSYVEWILFMVKKNRWNQLYFLSRDGYIIKILVDILVQERKIDLKTKYIYSSRLAWRTGAIYKEPALMETIFKERPFYTLDDCRKQLGISEINIKRFFHKNIEYNTVCSIYNMTLLVKRLTEIAKQDTELQTKLFNNYINMYEYLEAEVDWRDDRYAFVDAFGSGFTMECMAYVMKDKLKSRIPVLYFKHMKKNEPKACKFYSYIKKELDCPYLIESFTRSLEEQTIGYMKTNSNDKMFTPIQEGTEGLSLRDYGYESYLQGVIKTGREYAKEGYDTLYDVSNGEEIVQLINSLGFDKSSDVFKFLADMPISGNGICMSTFAPYLKYRTWRDIILGRIVYNGLYREWSIARCSDIEKHKITKLTKHKKEFKGRYEKIWKKSLFEKNKRFYFAGIPLLPKIIIYGAGRIGKEIYDELSNRVDVKVTNWIDRKFETPITYKNCVLSNLTSVNIEIDEKTMIVIAIMDVEIAEKIEKCLRRTIKNISQAKIANIGLTVNR